MLEFTEPKNQSVFHRSKDILNEEVTKLRAGTGQQKKQIIY